jgi:hypothetical protein
MVDLTIRLSQEELAECADYILTEAGDDPFRIVDQLERLLPAVAYDLITSDFFNAYQAWIWFFRTEPDDLAKDRMMLEPSSELDEGVLVGEVDLFDVFFIVRDGVAMIEVTDGGEDSACFSGRDAPLQAFRFVDKKMGL